MAERDSRLCSCVRKPHWFPLPHSTPCKQHWHVCIQRGCLTLIIDVTRDVRCDTNAEAIFMLTDSGLLACDNMYTLASYNALSWSIVNP